MENIQQDKDSVTEIKNHTGCFVDRTTGEYFFTIPVLAMAPTPQSDNPKEKFALFIQPGNTCQAVAANQNHLENASVGMYQAMLCCDPYLVGQGLLQCLPNNDFINNQAIDVSLINRAIGEASAMFQRPMLNNNPCDQFIVNNRLFSLKSSATRVATTDQVRLLAPDSSVNTTIDFSMNGYRDYDVWNVTTDDFESKFNRSIANYKTNNYYQSLIVRSVLYYQHWSINNYGKLNTCFGDTSIESLRYVLLKHTNHYVLGNDGDVYDFGFLGADTMELFKELFLLISCNKVDVNGETVDLNVDDLSQLNNQVISQLNGKINGLVDKLFCNIFLV